MGCMTLRLKNLLGIVAILGFIAPVARAVDTENEAEDAIERVIEQMNQDPKTVQKLTHFNQRFEEVLCATIVEKEIARVMAEIEEAKNPKELGLNEQPPTPAPESSGFVKCVKILKDAYGIKKLNFDTLSSRRKATILAREINRDGREVRNRMISFVEARFVQAISRSSANATEEWKFALQLFDELEKAAASDIQRQMIKDRRDATGANYAVPLPPFKVSLPWQDEAIEAGTYRADLPIDWMAQTLVHATYFGIPFQFGAYDQSEMHVPVLPLLFGAGVITRLRELGYKPLKRMAELESAHGFRGVVTGAGENMAAVGQATSSMNIFSMFKPIFSRIAKAVGIAGKNEVTTMNAELIALGRGMTHEAEAVGSQLAVIEKARREAQRYGASPIARKIIKYTQGWRFWATSVGISGLLEAIGLYYRQGVILPKVTAANALTRLNDIEADWAYDELDNVQENEKVFDQMSIPQLFQLKFLLKNNLKRLEVTQYPIEFLRGSMSKYRASMQATIFEDRAALMKASEGLLSKVEAQLAGMVPPELSKVEAEAEAKQSELQNKRVDEDQEMIKELADIEIDMGKDEKDETKTKTMKLGEFENIRSAKLRAVLEERAAKKAADEAAKKAAQEAKIVPKSPAGAPVMDAVTNTAVVAPVSAPETTTAAPVPPVSNQTPAVKSAKPSAAGDKK